MRGTRNFTVCPRDTGGTCGWMSCYGWHGHTDCINSKCYCRKGFCALDGYCVPQDACVYTTNVACGFYDCDASMGPTLCQSGECHCKAGSCKAPDGDCYEVCSQDTGGTCSWLSCDSDRGPTYCSKDYKCICSGGDLCSAGGVCVPRNMLLTEEYAGRDRALRSPLAIAALGAAASAVAVLVARVACRRRHRGATVEPLLS
eukprot:NODE_16651_length_984_cov_4.634772.p1 GENE.NODE_16651_length_984_cov_4.634772~~NODE_16651_length_984_cov_4.634772.p1  ORF type:complete len:201 (-),score=12.59 NODE_16651_length_984_cov_4.634772:305-907(-)